jgi:hypothetical protein
MKQQIPGPYSKERTEALEKATVTPYQMEQAQKEKDAEDAKKTAFFKSKAKEAINGFVTKQKSGKLLKAMKTAKKGDSKETGEKMFKAKYSM